MRKLEIGNERPLRVGVARRAVLKAVAASVVAGATSALSASVHSADDRLPNGAASEATIRSRPLMTVRITAAPPQKMGAVPNGIRIIVPVTGGDFGGPRLRGRILAGGGDWLLLRPDGVLELDLRITLETDDHALIYMTFSRGEAVDPASYYFRTVPRFETSAEQYAFLNRIITVGVGETRSDGAVHRIDEIL
jgi:Protein of unknown function (DUF3237)